MPKSNRSGSFGQRGGTVTVIEQPVLRSYMRKAKAVFWVAWVAITILSAVALSSRWEPITALFGGAVIGLVVAATASSIVAVWPILRVIWWWLPELTLTGGLITGWDELATHTGLIVRFVVVTGVVGIPAAIGPVRRYFNSLAWCQVSRHRIRACFNEFIISNRDGSLPLILGAIPTPAGTRLWVFLRPGLSLADIQDRTDKIAAACWANTIIADQANASNSAIVRIDIKRRDPLTGSITSPLKAFIGSHVPGRKPAPAPAPVGLDLDDVQPSAVTTASKNAASNGHSKRPQWPDKPAKNGDTLVGQVVPPGYHDELNDWI
jgi:hypothetical protein